MWKWLRSWFAWRFSLRRLVVAVVFLGAVVGLNVHGPRACVNDETVYTQWGWPLAFAFTLTVAGPDHEIQAELRITKKQLLGSEWLPVTHQTYRLMRSGLFSWAYDEKWCFSWGEKGLAYGGFLAVDALFALTVLFLILFLQIPRRKVAAKVE